MPELGVCKCCLENVSSEAKACPHCGQPDPYIAESNERQRDMNLIKTIKEKTGQNIIQHIRDGKPINAIKYVREVTGWGLEEAKEFVERLG